MLNLRELSAANPNTFGHGFEKHYLLQIYSIPDQWGIRVNIKLYSSEKSAGVPAMLWWNYPCIQAMVLGGFGMSSSACSRAGTRHEIRAIGLLARRFNPHDVRRAVIKIPVLCHFVVILGGIHMTQPRKPLWVEPFFFCFLWTTIQICMARFLHSSASQRCWMGLEGRAACTPIKFLHIRLGKRTVFMELDEASFIHPLHTEIDTLSASVASDNNTYGDGRRGTAGHPVIVRSLVLFSSVFLKLTKKI